MSSKGKRWTPEQRSRMSQGHLGHKVSLETRRKISRANKGRKRSQEFCKKMSEIHRGRTPWNKGLKGVQIGSFKGKRLTEEHKANISQSRRGQELSQKARKKIGKTIKKLYRCGILKIHPLYGRANPSWKGGVTVRNILARNSAKYDRWKLAVFEKDNWTCQKTGARGGDLAAHHIESFSEYPNLRFETGNGITLSLKEHRRFHRIYGSRTTAAQLSEFLGGVYVSGK